MIFSLFIANIVNADPTGACYLKVWKTIELGPGLVNVSEETTCEPLTLKKCHSKEKDLVSRGLAKACLMQSWVENEACKHL